MRVVIDFETRSTVDLKKCGAVVYAESAATDASCMAVAVDDDDPKIWVHPYFKKIYCPPSRYLLSDKDVIEIARGAGEIIAQNILFDLAIWEKILVPRFNWPHLPLLRLHDTMALLGYQGLPLNLSQAGAALNLPIRKDNLGHKIMLKLCKPRQPRKAEKTADPNWHLKTWWHEDPDDYKILFDYAMQDVATERLVFNTLDPLPPFERRVWQLDLTINMRGVPVDLQHVRPILELVSERERDLLRQFKKVVGGAVTGPRSYVALAAWVSQRIGAPVESLDKANVELLLGRADLAPDVRRALEIKKEIGKASVSKFAAMANRASADGRLRGMFAYYGAATGRWAGRGVQLHNLPRDSYGPADWQCLARLFTDRDVDAIQMFYDDPFFVASRCVRGAICTQPGRRFVTADFNAVEARGLAHLADDQPALVVFRSGRDPYKVAAETILFVDYGQVNDYQRLIGKVAELQLGYGGGIGAFATMAVNYRIDLDALAANILPTATDEELDGEWGARALARMYLAQNPGVMSVDAAVACDVIKRRWRALHPAVVRFWKEIESAAMSAVREPGRAFKYGEIVYWMDRDWLRCALPSGRNISYYQPQLRPVKTPWGDERPGLTYMGVKQVEGVSTRQWTRLHTRGPILVENIVQAFCRDLLAEAMLRVESHGYRVVLHVHDEAASECVGDQGSLEAYGHILKQMPPWAESMPLEVDGWEGRRYRKK